MKGGFFYNKSTRKYISLMISLFSNIYTKHGDTIRKVPVNYASKERFVSKLLSREHDITTATVARVENILPRIRLSLVNVMYNAERHTNVQNRKSQTTINNTRPKLNTQFNPTPIDFYFELGVYTRTEDDAFQIVEQILPYFQPQFVCKIKEIDENEITVDRTIPIVIETVQIDEDLEGDASSRRRIEWIMSLKLSGWLYPPSNELFGIIRTIYLNFNDEPSELVIINADRESVSNSISVSSSVRNGIANDMEINSSIRDIAENSTEITWESNIPQISINNNININWSINAETSNQTTINYEVGV